MEKIMHRECTLSKIRPARQMCAVLQHWNRNTSCKHSASGIGPVQIQYVKKSGKDHQQLSSPQIRKHISKTYIKQWQVLPQKAEFLTADVMQQHWSNGEYGLCAISRSNILPSPNSPQTRRIFERELR